jgi:hypothetical protein
MNSPLKHSKESTSVWYKEPWMLLVIGVPVVAICWGMVILTLAITGKDSLVSDSYYKDGMAYTENREYRDKAKRLQLTATLTYNNGEIHTTINGYLDEKPTFLQIQLIHPTLETEDETVMLQRMPDGDYLGLANLEHLGKRKLWLLSPEQEWMIKDEALIVNGKLVKLTQ